MKYFKLMKYLNPLFLLGFVIALIVESVYEGLKAGGYFR